MTTYVAFMRGINVGGNNKLPMKDLRRVFEDQGCSEVASYIQSGNVLFDASAALARSVPGLVAKAVEAEFGITSPVIVRSAPALRKIVAQHPLGDAAAEPKLFSVGLLDAKPKAAQIKSFEVDRFLPDTWEVIGTEIFMHFPNGSARSKLTNAYIDRAFDTISTVRNWNTFTKLVALCDDRP